MDRGPFEPKAQGFEPDRSKDLQRHDRESQKDTCERRGIERHAFARLDRDQAGSTVDHVLYLQHQARVGDGQPEVIVSRNRQKRGDMEHLGAALAKDAVLAFAVLDRHEITASFAEGVSYFIDDRRQLTIAAMAEPDRYGVEDITEHAGHAEDPDRAAVNRNAGSVHVLLCPGSQA